MLIEIAKSAATALAIIGTFWGALWILSLIVKDSSIGDPLYPVCMAIVAIAFNILGEGSSARQTLISVLTIIWAARLFLYIGRRNWGREDPRYARLRAHAESLGKSYTLYSLLHVFVFLGIVVGFPISFPLFVGQISPQPAALGTLAFAGVGVFAIGLILETVSDMQLARFKRHAADSNEVLQTGLWRYSRHPNYFGEFLVWTGFFLIALETPFGWVAVVSPLTVLWLLLGPMGIGLLERRMRKKRPAAFARYEARTSMFIPWFPKS